MGAETRLSSPPVKMSEMSGIPRQQDDSRSCRSWGGGKASDKLVERKKIKLPSTGLPFRRRARMMADGQMGRQGDGDKSRR